MMIMGSSLLSQAAATRPTVVVFQFTVSSTNSGDQAAPASECSDRLYSEVFDGLLRSNRVNAVAFDPRCSTVKRAIMEKTIKSSDLSGPADASAASVDTAAKLGAVMGADYALIGNIDNYSYPDKLGRVSLGVTTLVIDTRTGSVRNSITETAHGVILPTDKTSDEATRRGNAISDAKDDVLSNLLTMDQSGPVATKEKLDASKSTGSNAVFGFLMGVILGAI